MRNLIKLAFAVLPLLSACTANEPFVTFEEADDPVVVSERSLAAWDRVGKLEATWASADSLYSRSEVPVSSECKIMTVTGWKGERVSAQ